MSEQEPGPGQNPYGQPPSTPNPYGQAFGEQQTPPPYGGQQTPQPYGSAAPHSGDERPGTVTAAGWITIVLSGLSAAMFGIVGVLFLVARDTIVNELERVPEFEEANIDPDSVVGVMVAFMLFLVIWAVISVVLGVFVLRRSNVARILLVISSAVVALGSLLSITSGLSAIWLVGAIAVIAMLFVGGAGDWFQRTPTYPVGPAVGGYPGQGGDDYGQQGGSPYGGTPPQQGPQTGSSDYPSTDYPGR